jgi:glutamate/tyrosine decarboxylase-like PLP-dependent enzyme
MTNDKEPRNPLDMHADEFREAGHKLVDKIADFLGDLNDRDIHSPNGAEVAREVLGTVPLPNAGSSTEDVIEEISDLLLEQSLFNGHPRFWGYVNGSASPLGALGDLLASSINANVCTWTVAPVASEIERQTVEWIGDLLNFPNDPSCNSGGLLVSGGTMANITGLLAAKRARFGAEIREQGNTYLGAEKSKFYTTSETHAWLEKALDMMGFGESAIHRVATDKNLRMDTQALQKSIREDLEQGFIPLAVIASAGTVSTGAIDPLVQIAEICKQHNLWFHIDGAYGAVSACVPSISNELSGIGLADSVAMDAHKWLYVPFEAGCVLLRDRQHLEDSFSHDTTYYPAMNGETTLPLAYRAQGVQTSRGFRALKVWMCLKRAGRDGYVEMIGNNIRQAQRLYKKVQEFPELEAVSQGLSITTFRYNPPEIHDEDVLNKLNRKILSTLQAEAWAYPSHATVDGKYLIRVCITNFRTTDQDIDQLPDKVLSIARNIS